MYRDIEKLIRITLEERTTMLPDGEKLEILARCLDRSGGEAFRLRLVSMMKETRRLFVDISQRIATSPTNR
jgi:glutamine synthetase adenylyltransferase